MCARSKSGAHVGIQGKEILDDSSVVGLRSNSSRIETKINRLKKNEWITRNM